MYLHILKKDLKRKKAMNIILRVYIILATMFVSSSVNNILSVNTALGNYFQMADVPGYFGATMSKSETLDFEAKFENIEGVEKF